VTSEFIDVGNGDYTLVSDGGDIVVDASRVRWQGDELLGEVVITTAETSVGPLALSFMKPTSRRDAVAEIGRDNVEVAAAINDLCRNVLDKERENTSPIVRLCEVPKPTPNREYLLDLLPSVPRHHMAIWFGDGGVGKSLIALYAAGQLARQGVKTLYLDWELEDGEHRLRYEQIFGEAMPTELFYWRCDKPLKHLKNAVQRAIKGKRIEYVVVDSIAYACGGGVESSDVATEYANVVRSLGVGSLHLAHVTKPSDPRKKGGSDSTKMKPFGSVFWHGSARSTWYLERLGYRNGLDFDTTLLKLSHRKSNFSGLEQPRWIDATIGKNRGPFKLTRGLPMVNRAETNGATVSDRILKEVGGGKPRAEVRAALPDIEKDTFNKTVKRLKEKGILDEKNGVLVKL